MPGRSAAIDATTTGATGGAPPATFRCGRSRRTRRGSFWNASTRLREGAPVGAARGGVGAPRCREAVRVRVAERRGAGGGVGRRWQATELRRRPRGRSHRGAEQGVTSKVIVIAVALLYTDRPSRSAHCIPSAGIVQLLASPFSALSDGHRLKVVSGDDVSCAEVARPTLTFSITGRARRSRCRWRYSSPPPSASSAASGGSAWIKDIFGPGAPVRAALRHGPTNHPLENQ
jgi:hypothetical protein